MREDLRLASDLTSIRSRIVPTACAKQELFGAKQTQEGLSDLDFFIGNEAMIRSSTHTVDYPIRHGLIENWDDMERLWQRCFFDYLRCEPEVRKSVFMISAQAVVIILPHPA